MRPVCYPRPRGVHGFTLVELLVVIGVISLLISILLPVLKQVRQHALDVNCQSNLQQLALASMLYTIDHKGRFPYQPVEYVFDPFNPNSSGNWAGGLLKYVNGNKRVFVCPVVRHAIDEGTSVYNVNKQGIFYNYWYNTVDLPVTYLFNGIAAGFGKANSEAVGTFRRGAEKILIHDSNALYSYAWLRPSYASEEYCDNPWPYLDRSIADFNQGTWDFHLQGPGNYGRYAAFMDGHVSWVPWGTRLSMFTKED